MWALYDGANMLSQMDVTTSLSNYQDLINKRMNGNRAPFGLFQHFGWFNSNFNLLNQFITWTKTKPEIFWVTNRQLIEWMKNPVPYT